MDKIDLPKLASELRWARIWLLAAATAQAVVSVGFLFRTQFTDDQAAKEQTGDEAFGGKINDVCYLGLLWVAFVLFCNVALETCSCKKRVRVEMFSAIATMILALGYCVFVAAKLLTRLIGEGPFSPSVWWFWSCVIVNFIFNYVLARLMLSFLRSALVYRLDAIEAKVTASVSPLGSQQRTPLLDARSRAETEQSLSLLMTPNSRKTKKANDRRLFGSTFDWFYGKINGLNDDDDQEEAAEEEKLKKQKEKAEKEAVADGKEVEKDEPRESTIVQLLKMCAQDWPVLMVAFIAMIIAAAGQAMIPMLTGKVINTVSKNPDMEDLQAVTLKLLGVSALTAVFSAIRGSMFTIQGGTMNVRVRERLLKSLLSQDVGFFDQMKSGKLNSRLNSDTTTLSEQISLNLNVFFRSLVQALGVLIFMFRTNVELSLATFVTVPAVAIVTNVYGNIVWHLYSQAQKRLANANAVSDAALTTMHNVRCFASEQSELERWKGKMGLYYTLQVRMALLYAVYAMIFTLLPSLSTALVLFYGGKLVMAGSIQAGDLVSFMLYQQSLSEAINSIGQIFSGIAGALGAAEKVFELINRKPKENVKGNLRPENFKGQIEFKNVTFRYPARPENKVLDDVSLTIQPGEIVALVGASGGGKSSILKLLERLYDPEQGQVMLSGVPIQDIDHNYLHEKLTIVSQEAILYARSIAQNIMYGLEGTPDEPSMDRIIAAAKAANAHDFIMGFEDGYDTKCGDRGVTLSGGQKQRIAIARALVRSGDILLLDEATSALDAESEAQVQKTLDEIMQKQQRTCIVVAHRLSTIRNADRIIVMKAGKICESGSHDELVANKDSFYYSLVKKQIEGLTEH